MINMTDKDREKAMHDAISNKNFDLAIEHASNLPRNWNKFETMPSAAPMPDDATHKILDLLTHPYGHHKDSLPGFLFEYASNIPDHASPEILNRIADLGKEDHYVTERVTKHPNYKPDDKAQSLLRSSKFWKSYESKVDPSHFATIKSMFTGKPEQLKSHRGDIGSSEQHHHLIPDLKNHAKVVQDAILNDESIPKRYIKGEPYIQLYRGVNGHYGKAIRDKINYNPDTKEVDNKRFILPTAHLTSWTTNPKMAASFAWSRGAIEGQPENQGVVIPRLIPIKDVLHSGYHTIVPGQEFAHPNESEIVVGHPDSKLNVSSKEMQLQERPMRNEGDVPYNYGNTFSPMLRKSDFEFELNEDLYKSVKNKLVSAATTLSLLGSGVGAQAGNHDLDQPVTQNTAVTSIKPLKQKTPHPDLNIIKMIESSGGRNTQHKPMLHGPNKGTAAIGKYGIMPMQTIDTLKYDKKLSSKYPDLTNLNYQKDFDKIKQAYVQHPDLEEDIAHSHWNRLYNKFDGDHEKMAYAWLMGIRGAEKATPEQIKNNYYVQRFNKFKALMSLHGKEHLGKTESRAVKALGVTEFTPYTEIDANKKYVYDINQFIKTGETHDLTNVGHFSHKSFIAGLDPENSWLMKLEEKGNPAIKSIHYGLQSVKEVAFYYLANRVFDLGDFTPKAILGEVKKDGLDWPTVAIKMYPETYIAATDLKKKDPVKLRAILDRETQTGNLHKIAAMLYILGEADAHGNNLLVSDNDMKIIDHGTSFAGIEFNPATDKNIFIPYFMRVGKFKESESIEAKTEKAPKIKSNAIKSELKYWLYGLDANKIIEILNKFSIDPTPALKRLTALQKLVQFMPPDEAINYAWINGIDFTKQEELHEAR